MSNEYLHIRYLKLIIAIYKFVEAGLTPPPELIKQTQDLAQQLDIPQNEWADLSLFSEEAQIKKPYNIKSKKCSAENN